MRSFWTMDCRKLTIPLEYVNNFFIKLGGRHIIKPKLSFAGCPNIPWNPLISGNRIGAKSDKETLQYLFYLTLALGWFPTLDSVKTRPDHNAWSEVQLKIVDTEVKLKSQVKVNLLCFAGQGAAFSSYEISGLLPSLKIYSSRASLWMLMHENTYYAQVWKFVHCNMYSSLPNRTPRQFLGSVLAFQPLFIKPLVLSFPLPWLLSCRWFYLFPNLGYYWTIGFLHTLVYYSALVFSLLPTLGQYSQLVQASL